MEKDVVMQGFQGLKQMTINTFDVTTPTDSSHPYFEADVTIFNPAMVTIDPIGTISMKIKIASTGSVVGYVRAHDLSLVPGDNAAHLTGPMIPDSIDDCNAAMSDYFVGKPVPLIAEIDDIAYDAGSVSYPASDNILFEGGMKGTTVAATLQQDHVDFAAYAYSYANLAEVLIEMLIPNKEVHSEAAIGFSNPISALVTVTHLKVDVLAFDYAFAHIDSDVSLGIPGNTIIKSDKIGMDYYRNGSDERDVLEEIGEMVTSVTF